MVKGVNKTVIVVNNTGNKYFEQIVFYVTPEYGSLSAKQLKKAAEGFTFNLEENRGLRQEFTKNTLRKTYKRRRRIKLFGIAAGLLAVFALLALLIF